MDIQSSRRLTCMIIFGKPQRTEVLRDVQTANDCKTQITALSGTDKTLQGWKVITASFVRLAAQWVARWRRFALWQKSWQSQLCCRMIPCFYTGALRARTTSVPTQWSHWNALLVFWYRQPEWDIILQTKVQALQSFSTRKMMNKIVISAWHIVPEISICVKKLHFWV